MVGIVFYFENPDVDVWSGKNLDAWNYACKVAGDVTDMIVVNKTLADIKTPDAELNFQVVSELPELTGNVCYLACPWNIISKLAPLQECNHQTTDWYVFGPADGWGADQLETGYFLPQAGHGACHSVHIATAVMFHRYQDSLSWQ